MPPTESSETTDDNTKPKDPDGYEGSVAASPSVGKRCSVKATFSRVPVVGWVIGHVELRLQLV